MGQRLLKYNEMYKPNNNEEIEINGTYILKNRTHKNRIWSNIWEIRDLSPITKLGMSLSIIELKSILQTLSRPMVFWVKQKLF